MPASSGFYAHLVDLMESFGPVTVRRMFGGAGVFRDGVMFGLIADDTLYLKADRHNRGDFEATTDRTGRNGERGNGVRLALLHYRAADRRTFAAISGVRFNRFVPGANPGCGV